MVDAGGFGRVPICVCGCAVCLALGHSYLPVFSYKAGDRVFTSGTVTGGYAEYTIASEESVHPLPDNLNYKQGAAIGIPYFTAYRALFHK